MWYEVELIRMVNIETDSEFKTPAIQKLCRMEFFEFDKDCEGTIRKFLQDNFMQDGYYLVVGEGDGGFPEVRAVCNYSHGSTHFYFPGDEWQEKYKAAVNPVELPIRCFTGVNKKARLDNYVEKDLEEDAI